MEEFNAAVGETLMIRLKRTGDLFEGKVLGYETRGRGMSKYVKIQNISDGGVTDTYPATAIEAVLTMGHFI